MATARMLMRGRRWRAQDGFSAIELGVALSLAAIILAGASFNILNALALEALDGWTRSTTLDVAAAQQSAVTVRAQVDVTITSTTYSMAINGGSVIKNAKLPKDLTLTTTCTSNVCSFDRRGKPTSGSNVTITITSARTGRSHTITIQSNTGTVTYQ